MKKSRILKILGVLSVLAIVALIYYVGFARNNQSVHATTTSQNNIVARADYLYDITWECKKTVAGWVSGQYKEVMVADTLENNSDTIDKLKPGMLVQYLLNTEKRGFARYKDDPEEIILFNAICNFNNLGADFINWDYTSLTDVNARIKVYKGTVNYVDNDTFYVSIDGNTYVATMHGGTSVMKMNRDGSGKFTKASIDDVTVGSVVVVRQRYNNTREVFIVE